jgi:uncharacterized protein with GYD domain
MKFVLLGTTTKEWHSSSDPAAKVKAKLRELNIKLEAVHHTHGDVDFVDVVEVPNAEAVMTLSIWYRKQGYGRIHAMPCYDRGSVEAALSKAA